MWDASSTDETSHPDTPASIKVSRNICAVLRTPDKSGTSAASCVMCEAPRNASDIEVHRTVPHWSMERSLAALGSSSPSRILSRFHVDML